MELAFYCLGAQSKACPSAVSLIIRLMYNPDLLSFVTGDLLIPS